MQQSIKYIVHSTPWSSNLHREQTTFIVWHTNLNFMLVMWAESLLLQESIVSKPENSTSGEEQDKEHAQNLFFFLTFFVVVALQLKQQQKKSTIYRKTRPL